MTSYLRSWFTTGVPAESDSVSESKPDTDSIPSILKVSQPGSDDEDDGDATETERDRDDDDSPPAFPAPFSAQRAASGSDSLSTKPAQTSRTSGGLLPRALTDTQLMPPPPPPQLGAGRTPGVASASTTPSSSLALPPSTTKRPTPPSKKRTKVALAPGHSPLDWANLKTSGEDLRGVDTLMRITPSMLKQHNKRDDAWSAFSGKVYNITPYLAFHPGGERELMRVAGRDGTKLFGLTHAWVNVDYMLDACMVGFLVPES
ncbi:hypothetical protein HGRIS_003384 [Hohenbuehelia grisea]|uniref:Cytochrome b5 heme-binding domain-containing protein n=1 Tax=Hohenbuehelia grisea TaxID=104357 RepID=A0ABR3JGX5_9AGAR